MIDYGQSTMSLLMGLTKNSVQIEGLGFEESKFSRIDENVAP